MSDMLKFIFCQVLLVVLLIVVILKVISLERNEKVLTAAQTKQANESQDKKTFLESIKTSQEAFRISASVQSVWWSTSVRYMVLWNRWGRTLK